MVNALSPGFVMTELTKSILSEQDMEDLPGMFPCSVSPSRRNRQVRLFVMVLSPPPARLLSDGGLSVMALKIKRSYTRQRFFGGWRMRCEDLRASAVHVDVNVLRLYKEGLEPLLKG